MRPIATEHLSRLLDAAVTEVTAVGGGDICDAFKLRLPDDRVLFAKSRPGADDGFFDAEADGLRRLRSIRQGVPTPAVMAVDRHHLVLEWVDTGSPSPHAAERFGRALAATHRSGANVFGSHSGDGWIGTLRLPGGPWPDWHQMWVDGRLEPYLRAARERGSLSATDSYDVGRVIDHIIDVSGPDEPPSLIHGDLWAGNVLWGADGQNRLIDPAVHGGHRETDLAMLALFGLPYLDRVIASYHDVWPLADGWRERVALHQLHPVLVHAVLFGGSYGPQAGRLARQVLSTLR